MKKVAVLFILALIPIWGLFYYIGDRGIQFDPMTEQHIKDYLQTENLSKNIVKSVETLDLSNQNLTSVEGLEAFTNLEELNLSGNLLTDVSAIAGLEKLTTVDLSFNQLKTLDIHGEQLVKLNLESNRLWEIDFVEQMPALKNLNLRANHVVDLSPLTGHAHLKALNIRGNQVKELDPLESIRTLVDLNARNNQILSVLPLKNLPLTKRLNLNGNNISDLEELALKLIEIDDIDFDIPIPTPEFRKPSGVYTEAFELELRTAKRHQIYYTLDGTKPTLQSHHYTEPIEISHRVMREQPMISNYQTSPFKEAFEFEPTDVKKAMTVTAASYINGQLGKPLSYTYILDRDLFNSKLPVVSLTMDPRDFFNENGGIYVPGAMYEKEYPRTGNYYQRGRDNEKEGTMEIFHEDGSVNFRQTIGARINGSYTRMLPQKSLRIYPRSDYGQSRIYSKLFEDVPYHEFDLLVLRSSGNDNNSTLLRDGLMHELIKDRGLDVQGYQPSIVLLNGEYWGIHNIREKYNDSYIDIKYNVKEKDLTMLSVNSDEGIKYDVDIGAEKDQTHYLDLLRFVDLENMTQDSNVEHVDTLMDIDNFLEYVAVQVYYGNTDSFHNNMTVWRKKTEFVPNAPLGHDGRWRWMVYDLDWGMGYGLLGLEGDPIKYNMLGDMLIEDDKAVLLFKELMNNDALKERFTEKMLFLLQNNFDVKIVEAKIDELAARIRPEIPQSIARWENIESVAVWEENIETLHEFAKKRPAVIKSQLMSEFGFTQAELKALEKKVSTEQ